MSNAFDGPSPSFATQVSEMSLREFEQQRFRIAHLNQVGLELYALKRYKAAVFHFNEAFQVMVPLADQILLQEKTDSWDYESDPLAGRPRPAPRVESFALMTPLFLESNSKLFSLADVQEWILLAMGILLLNGALAHINEGNMYKAEDLLLFATSIDQQLCNTGTQNTSLYAVVVSIYHLLGLVQGNLVGPFASKDKSSKVSPERVEQTVESFDRAIRLASDCIKGNRDPLNMTVAAIYLVMGRFLAKEGYIHGAARAFDQVKVIYDTPHLPVLKKRDSNVVLDFSDLTDVQLSQLLQMDGCDIASPAA